MSSRAGRCFLSLAIVAVVFGMAPLVPAQMRKAWVATYDSPDKDRDVPAALAVDPLGNIVVSGYSRSGSLSSTADFATVKYSPSGQELWAQVYDGPAGSSDVPTGLAIDHLGYIFVTGPSARASETESDYATVKYDADGTELWVRRYEGPGGFDAIPCAVAVDADGNAVVTGESASITETNLEFTTVKYDPDGRELWVRRYGGPGQACRPRALAIDAAGHVLVTGEGHFGDARYSDFVTVKYSPDGGELWVRRFDGLGGLADIPVGIAVDPAGNVHVAGESRSSGGSGTDYATVKYAPDGTRLWVREYKGPANKSDRPVAVAVDAAGKVHVTGVSPGESTKVDWATLAYDRDGNELWVARYAEL